MKVYTVNTSSSCGSWGLVTIVQTTEREGELYPIDAHTLRGCIFMYFMRVIRPVYMCVEKFTVFRRGNYGNQIGN